MAILKLERRGCEFFKDEPCAKISDVGNYRLDTHEYIHGKDGNDYYLEFTLWHDRWIPRYTHKITGKPLKHWKKEIINPCALHLDTCYTAKDGMSYGNLELEKQIHDLNLPYTEQAILQVANIISTTHYDTIKYV